MTARPQPIQKLRDEIDHHDRLYHDLNQPEISDQEYDRLLTKLRDAEAAESQPDPRSPTQRVGFAPSSGLAQVTHDPPMLSLANAHEASDFRDWVERTSRSLNYAELPLTAELKIDGLAVALHFDSGRFDQAATRGDGKTGEDVTHTIATIRDLPRHLTTPATITVRGEVYMPNAAFEDINQRREAQGLDLYANPRNAAAGAVRQHDPAEASEKGLSLWVYSLNPTDLPSETSQQRRLQALRQMGLPINPHTITTRSSHDVMEYYQTMLQLRPQLEYETDGIVVKVDDLQMQERLGATSHDPRWAVAWKFPAARAVTRLRSISISVGRFGKLTPVAELEPVTLDGATISRASLHNEQDLRRKDIRAGDDVVLERAGGVIPQVLASTDTDPLRLTTTFEMPAHCPECSSPVHHDQDEAAHWCTNEQCPPKIQAALEHFVSKDALDIDGIGPVLSRHIIRAGLINNPADIFDLTEGQIAALDHMGPASAKRVRDNIQLARKQPMERLIYSLGVFRLGHHVSRVLAERYDSLDQISALSKQELIRLPGVSDTIADAVLTGLSAPRTIATIQSMRRVGIITEPPEELSMTTPANSLPPIFAGTAICVTGTLSTMTRTQAHSQIRAREGIVHDRVTKKTNVLVVGDRPGSKLNQAEKLGVKVWHESDFIAKLATNGQDQPVADTPAVEKQTPSPSTSANPAPQTPALL